MNQWLNNASSGLKKSRLAGACRILPCIFGADIGAQLGHNLNQFVTSDGRRSDSVLRGWGWLRDGLSRFHSRRGGEGRWGWRNRYWRFQFHFRLGEVLT